MSPARRVGRPGARWPVARRPPAADPARDLALAVLQAVEQRDAYANLMLPELLRRSGLSGRDAAFATGLVYGTLRAQGTLDAVLTACLDRAPADLDAGARAVLRLGAYQLLVLGTPAHAGVSASVDLARRAISDGVARLVNAVLRRVADHDLATWLDRLSPDPGVDPVGDLALRSWHPAWVVAAFRDALGGSLSEAATALAADNDPPAVTLAARPGRIARDELLAAVEAAGIRLTGRPRPGVRGSNPGPADPDGQDPDGQDPGGQDPGGQDPGGQDPDEAVVAVPTAADLPDGDRPRAGPLARAGCWSRIAVVLDRGDPARLGAVRDGRAGVQDEGSQLVALALAAAPTTGTDTGWWLDSCAGPGGKAAVLAGLADTAGARLLGGELAPHRARLVGRALAGTAGAAVLVADATAPAWPDGAFDRVLLDAPCSGLGSLRRRPEARWRRSPADVATLRRIQRALLGAALRAVRPGGVVAYATCSPHPAETGVVVGDAVRDLARAADPVAVERLHTPDLLPAGLDLPAERDDAQLWPHRHGTDAMYLALLRRT